MILEIQVYAEGESPCAGIITGALYTGREAAEANLGIDSLVSGYAEKILTCNIDARTLDVPVLERDVVGEGEVVELEVGGVFQILGRVDGVAGEAGVVQPGGDDVAKTDTGHILVAGPVGVVHLSSDGGTQGSAQGPVAVVEAVAPADVELGIGASEVAPVFFGNAAGDAVHEVVGAVFPDTLPDGAVEGAEALTLDEALSVGVNRVADVAHLIAAVLELFVGEFLEGVLVGRHGEGGVPGEVLSLHGDGVQGELYAHVLDGAYVGKEFFVVVGRHRDLIGVEKVGGVTVVEVQGASEAAFEEAEVETGVHLFLALPAEVGVGVARGSVAASPVAVVVVMALGFHEKQRLVVGEVLVAGDAVAHTELEFVEPALVLEPFFLTDAPAEADCREERPLVVLSEAGGAVVTKGDGGEVALGPVVHHAAEEGYVAAGFLVGRHVRESLFQRAAGADVVGLVKVGVEAGVLQGGVPAVVLLVGVTGDGLHGVKPEKTGVLEHALPLKVGGGGVGDVGLAIFADEAGIVLGAVFAALVALGLPAHEVVPFEALHRKHVEYGAHRGAEGVDVSFVVALVEHGHGVVVVHGAVDTVVATRKGVVGIVDWLGGVVHEGLTEDVVVGRGVLAVEVVEVVVEREPAFEGLLMDVALDEVFAHVVLLQQTLVLFDVGHGTMAERLAAARHRKAVLVAERNAGDLFEPVGIGPVERADVTGGILVDHVLELGGGEGHRARGDRLHAGLAVVFDRSLACLGPAGGDDDNTVGAAGTVDGGGGAVLEHVDGFDLLEVDAADVGIGHAVDDDERALTGSECSGASEQQFE